jgi:hypothetical protein
MTSDAGTRRIRSPQTSHVLVAPLVTCDGEVVDLAVDLDDELGRWAIEVSDIGPDRMLASESDSSGGSPQKRP